MSTRRQPPRLSPSRARRCSWLRPSRVKINAAYYQKHKETIKTASMSAASGGVTSIICMPNTVPPIDQPAIIQSIQRNGMTLIPAIKSSLLRLSFESG